MARAAKLCSSPSVVEEVWHEAIKIHSIGAAHLTLQDIFFGAIHFKYDPNHTKVCVFKIHKNTLLQDMCVM